MTAMVPYPSDRPNEVGIIQSMRLRSEERRTHAEVARLTIRSYVNEMGAQLAHNHALRDQQRHGELTDAGLQAAGQVYNSLVRESGGDEAKAAFLTPIAVAGRDAIRREIR